MGIILPLGQGKPAPNLLAWLKAHPAVGAAIIWENGPVNPLGPDPLGPTGPPLGFGPLDVSTWGGSMQQELITAFRDAWGGVLILGTPEPDNIIPLADADEIRCGLRKRDAWSLYVRLVGWSLAAELSGQLGWSITGYDPDSLALLFDSRQTFHWRQNIGSNPLQHGYELDMVEGVLLPAPPELVLGFMARNRLIGGTPSETIVSLIEWAHQNLVHYGGGDDTANIVDQWQYRGFPPLSKVLAGTPHAKNPGDGIRHRTAGCWGTAGFFHSMLRVINVPARAFGLEGTGHMTVQFPSEGLYFSHGDDPYNVAWSSIAPVTSPASLLIDQAQFDAWFNGALSDDQKTANVGRQPLELALANLSNWLLHTYSDDQSAGHGHADGVIAQELNGVYSVAQLEAMNLWNRMDAKIAALGGIGNVPSWRPQPTDAAIPQEQGSDGPGMAE